MQFESRTIPQGLENDISICTMNFTSPLWITPPAKVKKLGIVTKIRVPPTHRVYEGWEKKKGRLVYFKRNVFVIYRNAFFKIF